MPTALRPFLAALAGAITGGIVACIAKYLGIVVEQDQADAIKTGVEVFLLIAVTYAGQHIAKFFAGVKHVVEKKNEGPVIVPAPKPPQPLP